MSKNYLLATMLLLAPAAAHAGGQSGSIGVGAEFQLSGIGGPSIDYDAGQFHVGGFLGVNSPRSGSLVETGARFFYHVHSTAMSDFGIGGSFGLASVPAGQLGNGSMNRETFIFIEPSFQIRLFLASNVALSFTAGITIGTADANDVAITGQTTGIAGVHYYFF